MRKIILTYGLISGAIVSVLILATIPLWKGGFVTFENGEFVGYTTMVIALSMIFFGIKSCRDYQFKGSITFWQGIKIGLMITLIASIMYAITWLISLETLAPEFTENLWQAYIDKARAESQNEAELNAALQQVETWKEWYKNPLLRFALTMMEILPVGIFITLISAAILRRRQVLPA